MLFLCFFHKPARYFKFLLGAAFAYAPWYFFSWYFLSHQYLDELLGDTASQAKVDKVALVQIRMKVHALPSFSPPRHFLATLHYFGGSSHHARFFFSICTQSLHSLYHTH